MKSDLWNALALRAQGDSPEEAAETAGVPVALLAAAERDLRRRSKPLADFTGGVQRLPAGCRLGFFEDPGEKQTRR